MTRGRPPKIGLKEAEVIASRRGDVVLVPGNRSDAFDLILFEPFRTVFVKVKRAVTQVSYPLEILHRYQRELAHLHRIPLTVVTAREFWLRTPRGKWQFFLVRHDSLVEIRADGTYAPPADLPIVVPSDGNEQGPGSPGGPIPGDRD